MGVGMAAETRDYGIVKTADTPHCTLRNVDLSSVRWTDGFWADRFRQCCEVTLPHLYDRLADPSTGHVLQNLKIAAGLEPGTFQGTDWQDEWAYKWLEAATAVYAATRDRALERRMDGLIDVIAAAQQADGYVASQVTAKDGKRFVAPHRHELYVMGHLITAACLHHRITGKRSLLDVATRAADFVDTTFRDRPPELVHFPVNPSIIMALVDLYRTTGTRRYLDLAGTFVDMRGSAPGGRDHNQDTVPLRDEVDVVGHAVFFTYLYAGATDVYMETGEKALLAAVTRLWKDLTERKLYITGGVCALHHGRSQRSNGRPTTPVHEAAGSAYELPSATAYNETCAQVGSVLWNWRMLAATGDAAYGDLVEHTLYNGVLPGIGLDGRSWFYTNPLRWYGKDHLLLSQDAHERYQPGEPPARKDICCPSNLLRTVAELHGYAYSLSEHGLTAQLYGSNVFDGPLRDGSRFRLRQQTGYPWEGSLTFCVEQAPARPVTLGFRIPAWARGATLEAKDRRRRSRPGTYARVRESWEAGDVVRLTLPMPVRMLEAHPRAEELRNQVAVMRGPLVYCLESIDLPEGVHVDEVHLARRAAWTAQHDPTLLQGVTVLEGEGRRVPRGTWEGTLYRTWTNRRATRLPLRLIPYYARANRKGCEMTVWMPLR